MRVTVKIGTVEVTVDRPDFKKARTTEQDFKVYETTVKPTLIEATQQAKELYKLQPHHVEGVGYKQQPNGYPV